MKIVHFAFIVLLSLFVTSCSTVQVSTDYDRSANFSTYKTYSYHEKGLDKLKVNDLDKRRLLTAIDTQMAAKGFTKVSSDADLVVNVLTSTKEKISVSNNNWGYGPYGYYGGYYGGTNVSQYQAGTIVIDIIDDKKNVLVWQGVGADLNLSNISAKAERIPKAVEEILSKFPPQPKK
ncbi:DUF4136 domain-containing protein [Algoriella sp.]|uniref:DUF4136 domain-containing protein n=1 Tax=Algoriella sp. TaxID=1872434 RepID=UPI001B01FB4D|nr:DUF4136 domain-containing protein [Algoriella sp.]MBO6212024.1 DUF4136 domain-containing protein [Algoriella sp.]